MKGLLLDTNALIWTLTADARLGQTARSLITDTGAVRYSSVSVLEVTIKTMLGKLSLPGDFQVGLDSIGLTELPLTARHAAAVAEFPDFTRHDPFDRMLLAQANVEQIRLLTADTALLGLGVTWVIDARA
ncbi:type II toxin-antitoxin system VapC family toxin [Yimella sp. cx-51]|uniref:type II toxin-antitoxin system VapC family toxin n=1 Tax=Yimella sp. cx-51 TaxID=2770551 RepID=UPI00165E9EE3|nr:type II toxin-antitoxin system VapC family toxin [Yimella sp. cx-51]MBC9957387.1 type II toxin-antitoxin system VapC family toxin [Yimella sp. cx-51]QTH39372.1 type II toxin-antitoxin system VapC family toxin [Yimella sp. cx-51]